MDNLKTHILKITPEILSEYPVAFAYLYGSYSIGLEHRFSDLDICIYIYDIPPKQKLSLQMAIALEIDEKIGTGINSDVRIMNDLPLIIRGHVVSDGLLIYSRDDELLVEVETSTRKAYFDFLPVIKQYQQAFIDNGAS